MAGASLLTLLDDIATVLDDIALMSKVAAKKTAGVLGDDLALNAQQVSGIASERELPVVWSVAKGSFRNKLILVPAALLISAFIPWLITPLLLIGGLFLCFEGAEKILEKLFHSNHQAVTELPEIADIAEFEKKKISGAIRTDFILSAEIIVIALGTVQGGVMSVQIGVVSFIAIAMTIGVYGLVAAIVKFDDLGLYLIANDPKRGLSAKLGEIMVNFAPKLMKCLTVIGTLAMFLVGGGIVVHSLAFVHHIIEPIAQMTDLALLSATISTLLNGLTGLLSGLVVVAVLKGMQWIKESIS